VVVSTALLSIVLQHDDGAPEKNSSLGNVPSDLFEGPFPGGRQVTMQEALKETPYPVYIPSSRDASSDNMSKVWIDDGGDIGLQYDSNITVMMWPSAYKDPEAGLQNVLATTTAKADLIRVGESPGIEMYPNTASNKNPAWVEFVRDGVDINIFSSTQPIEALVAVADSMERAGA
jgi:hypothetical protein